MISVIMETSDDLGDGKSFCFMSICYFVLQSQTETSMNFITGNIEGSDDGLLHVFTSGTWHRSLAFGDSADVRDRGGTVSSWVEPSPETCTSNTLQHA